MEEEQQQQVAVRLHVIPEEPTVRPVWQWEAIAELERQLKREKEIMAKLNVLQEEVQQLYMELALEPPSGDLTNILCRVAQVEKELAEYRNTLYILNSKNSDKH